MRPRTLLLGGAFVDQLNPANLVVPIAVIDISARAALNPDTMVNLDDILAYEAQYGQIPENAAVFMDSGWAKRWGEPEAFVNLDEGGTQHYPGFSQEATDFLILQRNIAGIGVDTLSSIRATQLPSLCMCRFSALGDGASRTLPT